MGTVEDAVRSAMTRVVRRECRVNLGPLTGEVRELARRVVRLESVVKSLEQRSGQLRPMMARAEFEGVADDEVRRARLSPDAIKRLRAGLGVTQAQLAALIGVTGPAVAQWEGGTSEPRGRNRAALVALKKLGRRGVRKLLGGG